MGKHQTEMRTELFDAVDELAQDLDDDQLNALSDLFEEIKSVSDVTDIKDYLETMLTEEPGSDTDD